jgi:hypothetical protein
MQTHFLTIDQHKKNGTKLLHKFYFDDESKSIVRNTTLLEGNMETEDFDTQFIDINSFAVNIDRYMYHPGKVWADDNCVEELMMSYLFDEEIFE